MTKIGNVAIRLGDNVIEKWEEIVYFGHIIELGKESNRCQVHKRVQQTWTATSSNAKNL